MLDPVISNLVMLGGAVLFGAAAFHKLRSPAAFAAALAEYRMLPDAAVPVAGIGLALLELAVAAALLWQDVRAAGALSGAALLVLYACAIALSLIRGRRDLDCGCGFRRTPIGGWMVVRNLLLAGLLLTLCLPAGRRALSVGDVATIAAALGVAVLLYASIELVLGRAAPRDHFRTEHP